MKGAKKNYPAEGGHTKISNLILYVLERNDFRAFVTKARSELDIPPGGFPVGKDYPYPPKQWRHKDNPQTRQKLEKEIRVFCRKHNLHHLEGSDVLTTFLLYNTVEIPTRTDLYELCIVSDLVEEKRHPYGKATQDDDDRLYPIAIRISPDASERDVLEFVKRVFNPHIKSLQENYREPESKIGKLRKRKKTARELGEFVYQRQHLPRKRLMSLVNENFGTKSKLYDYAEISKIISLEKRRRG